MIFVQRHQTSESCWKGSPKRNWSSKQNKVGYKSACPAAGNTVFCWLDEAAIFQIRVRSWRGNVSWICFLGWTCLSDCGRYWLSNSWCKNSHCCRSTPSESLLVDETAQHSFWDCTRWQTIRSKFPILLRLFHLVGSQWWPNCFLHCGWFEQGRNYGLQLLDSLQLTYDHSSFIRDTHQMYLQILLCRYEATQVLQSTPVTPPDILLPSSILSSPSLSLSLHSVQLQGEVSPISVRSSEPG